MKSSSFMVALDEGRGLAARIVKGAVETREFTLPAGEGDAPDPVPAIKEALSALRYDGSGILLGLASREVLSALVATDGLPRRDRQKMMVFKFEEHLPMDAEGLAVDFLPPTGNRALGVATATAPLVPLIEHMAEAGIEVEMIVPTAILALWQLLHNAEKKPDFCLLSFADHVDIFRLLEGVPVSWNVTTADAAQLTRTIHASLLAHLPGPGGATALLAGPLAEDVRLPIARETGVTLETAGEDAPEVLAARAVPEALSGGGAGWVDLRRGALAMANPWGKLERPLRVAILLALVLMAVVSTGAWYRSTLYRAEADRLVTQEQAVFGRLYPNTRVPPGVRRFLASESSRLSALSGAGTLLPDQPAALDTLQKVMAGLPPGLRLRVGDVRIEPGEVLIEGQARTHGDAESIARGIATSASLAMESPRTETLVKGGVAFTLAGKPVAPTKPVAPPGSVSPASKAPPPPPPAKGGKP